MKKKKVAKVIYSCGCHQVIPVRGISGGVRCPNHMSMQKNGCVREVPKKSDIRQELDN